MVELLQGLGLLLRIFMPVAGAFDALDRMAKDALRDMRGLSNQRLRFSRQVLRQSRNPSMHPFRQRKVIDVKITLRVLVPVIPRHVEKMRAERTKSHRRRVAPLAPQHDGNFDTEGEEPEGGH